MKILLPLFVIIGLVLFSCKNDKTPGDNKQQNEEITTENIKNQILKLDNPTAIDTSVTNNGTSVSNAPISKPISETQEVKKAKKKLKVEKEKVIEKKMETSKYKKMNCEKMIIKYKSIIEEYKKTKNEELLLWKDTNDPIYKFCYEKHTAVFDSLERVENELFQDEEY